MLRYSGEANNSALIFVLAIVLISRFTTGYLWGIAASVIGVFCINYAFMYPYQSFNLTIYGYPLAFLSMLATSLTICALTSQIKFAKEQAQEREQQTKLLYELNQQLAGERAGIQLAAEREKLRGDLLRAISHDLRTPLTGIFGASSVIATAAPTMTPTEIAALATDIATDSKWLIRMVENLLSVTKINAEGGTLQKKPEALEEIMANAAAKIKKSFTGCQLTVTAPTEFLEAPMDALLIEQVLINLLENAFRHGGCDCRVDLRGEKEGNYAICSVRDNGRGLNQDAVTRFNQGEDISCDENESTDSSRGRGIGLSVCRSIIKAHDGYLEAAQEPTG
ncbi:MAG: DUF4118 domain-containing protein, partial [Clostridiales bacterium]